MLGPKLAFFSAMAAEVEPFLKEFHSESLLVLFLYGILHSLLKPILERFVKGDVIEKELSEIDLDALRNVKSHVKEVDILLLKQDGVKFYRSFRLTLKSPLANILERSVTCLDPSVIGGSNTLAQQRMNNLLSILVEKRWCRETSDLKKKSRNAYSRYIEHLELKKKRRQEEMDSAQTKKQKVLEIKALKSKKAKLLADAEKWH
ncbi:hypothetical protein PR048_019656 [Dryococelus australis]|uniref:Uncharacterized protein n=1 Tax=Dryococelus australis TaxID=614101 RepID=A0ABQ9H438_9NEOP|nr:hypothetical protein PR048_019656 [Dryococelus australis]